MMTKSSKKHYLQWMVRADLEGVKEIESHSVAPVAIGQIEQMLRKRNCIGMTHKKDGVVAGYFIYRIYHRRYEITRMNVHRDHQREGIGTSMVVKLKTKIQINKRQSIVCVVPDIHTDFQLFLKANGFRAVEVLRDYWEGRDGYRDGYKMRYVVNHSS